MFKQSITSTAMTTDAANIFFSNITGAMFGSDNTFLATLRALIAPRIPEGESVNLSFGRSDYGSATIADTQARQMVEAICGHMPRGNGQIYVHNLSNRDEGSNIASIELLKQKFCDVYEGWEYLEKISVFYQKSFKVICFINKEIKSVAIFVDQLNLQKLHYLQMSALAFLPWYFDAGHGIEETEMDMLKALRERTSEKWEECITRLAKKYDFETGRIRQLLGGFETRYEEAERNRVKNEISRVDREIHDLDRRFADYIKSRNDLCIKLIGLETRIENGADSELMEYFLCNRRLYLEDTSSTVLYFAVRDYLSYFDEDAAQSYINNKNGYFYRSCNSSMTKDGMHKLLTAIFVDQTIRIRFCAAYYFDINGSVSADSHHHFNPSEFEGYRPNPHIQEYACMGNYRRTINDALARRDYISALEQCIASAKSLNFHDSTVMNTFISDFTSNSGNAYKAIELPDGSIVTPKEAIKWIEAQEAAANAAAGDENNATESAERMAEVPADAVERIAAAEPNPFD